MGAKIQAAAFSPTGKTLITFALRPREERPRDLTNVKAVIEHWEVGTGPGTFSQVDFELAADQRPFVFAPVPDLL